jgi:hypothetical protein
MSWLFSQALVEEYSAVTSSDGEQFAQLNVMPTPHKFWRNDKTMEFSSLSRFGLTLRLLTESHGEELLMSYLAVSRAKTLAQQEKALVSKAKEAAYGQNLHGLLAIFDRVSSLWKTAQYSLLADSEEYSETWPRWGLMRAGAAYLLVNSGPITRGNESGLLLTPTATDCKSESMSLALVSKRQHESKSGRRLAETLLRRLIPTPQAGSTHWAGTLQELGGTGNLYRGTEIGKLKISPRWTEQRMDFPTDWTSLKPLEMHKFHEWQQQHGIFLEANK